MELSNLPLFSMLRSRLDWLGDRQRLLAQNVANVDTPEYVPQDLKPFQLPAPGTSGVKLTLDAVRTAPAHMAATIHHATPRFKTRKVANSETTLDQNGVVLEEQMLKMNEARADYDAAISFYQKSMGMIRMANRTPGRG